MDASPADSLTNLHRYAIQSDLHNMEVEIANGADINAKDCFGQTALHTAIAWLVEDTETLQLLIDRGIDIDATDDMGRTALYFAASERNYEQVKCLLDAGADPTITDHKGRRPSQADIYFGVKDEDDVQILDTLATSERRQELQQIAAQSRPAEAEIAPPRRSSGFMM